MAYISRVEPDGNLRRTRGWLVKFRVNGRWTSKLFSDGVYGDEDKALRRAKVHRDERAIELGKPLARGNAFGSGYVRRFLRKQGGTEVWYWVAFMKGREGYRKAVASERIHGKKEAKRLMEARLEGWRRELDGSSKGRKRR